MRVLQVVPRLHGGGVERGALEVASALVRGGHDSMVVSEGGRLVERLEREGSRHFQMPVGRKRLGCVRSISHLRALVRRERPDVVHPRSRLPAWLCWLSRDRTRSVPGFVTSIHGLYSVSRYSRIMTRGDLIEVVSDTARNYLLDNYPGVDEARIRTIHRGVDGSVFHAGFRADEDWKRRWRAKTNGFEGACLLLPGRLTRLKGHFELLEVCRHLIAMNLSFRAFVAGGVDRGRETYARDLRSTIESDSGLREHVVMLGHRDDLRELMSVADVVLSLSVHPEAFGRTVLEALALGRQVVGFDHGGVGELLHRFFSHGAVPLGNIRAVAERVVDLVRNPQPIRVPDHTLEKMNAKTMDMYREFAG